MIHSLPHIAKKGERMRQSESILASVVFLLLGAAPGASTAGTHAHERNGFLIGFGLGGGSAGIDSDGGREGGAALNFRVGYALRPDLALHLEVSSWYKEQDGTTATFDVFAPALTYYPGNVGFHVRAGVGLGTSHFEAATPFGTYSQDQSGLGVLVTAGYEIRLSRKFALGPQIDYAYLGAMEEGIIDSANFVNGSLQFNWYW